MSKPGVASSGSGAAKPQRTSSSMSSAFLSSYSSRRSTSSMSTHRVDAYVPVLDAKSAIVIELGSRYTRIGFAGEYYPRELVRSEVEYNGKFVPVFCPGRSDEEDREVLFHFFRKIFFKYILCSVKERRLMIVESLLTPTEIRSRIASVLFDTPTFSPPSILFAPSHLLHTIPFSVNTALVVDVGYSETVLIPIFEGVTMMNNYECSPICSRLLEERICSLLKENGKIEQDDGITLREIRDEDLNRMKELNIIEDIAVRVCFATKLVRGRKIQEDAIDFDLAVETRLGFIRETVIIPGIVREKAAELFFELSHHEDSRSVTQLILDCLIKLPMDMRRPMISNMTIVGGAARMTGFLARLKSELELNLTENEKYNHLHKLTESMKFYVHREAPIELYGAWLGGSLLGSLDIWQSRATSREDWLANKKLPDWMDKIDNYLKSAKEN